ncbi:hypothetical protein CHS0354_008630 [Potamilus streckersoni]|uniref:1-phosphatidylinositol 4,5-bisphosphate phosphodiesterase gamma n=1 Tax=Potamilus streckersoni TaxID=2493646 RepID=A0AAE0TH76_9BIVA|nr:hypothetical protein CHS0354_008630 [Potamilus streckersoni]
MAAPVVYNGLPNHEMLDVLMSLERGLVVTIFFCRKRPERRTLKVKLESSQLVWIRAQGARPEGAINLRSVKEIRPGKSSKDFDRWQEDGRKHDKNLCFVVFYGSSFKLHTLSVVASTQDEFQKWKRGLDYLEKNAKMVSYPTLKERWLRREFYDMDRLGQEKITLKSLKAWMQKVNYKISTNRLRERFNEVDTTKRGEICFQEFAVLFHKLAHDSRILSDIVNVQGDRERNISVEKFQQFLVQEQKETRYRDGIEVRKEMKEFLDDTSREVQLFFTEMEFVDYLFSKRNTVWDSRYDKVNQDMSHPLSHYWISSSHNTYLTGDQISSESSTEAYVRCLRMGCRCIELDCWDGPDGYPQIYHGHTLTSRIRFLDVIKIIREHAWVASDYPLILSIENHCTLGQQRNMASAFRDTFGEMLLTEPISRDATDLPSPEQLKFKIILKHKKLPADGTTIENDSRYMLDDNAREGDLSNSVKNGIMYMEDLLEPGMWRPHFFVLTPNKLSYTEETSHEEEDVEDENTAMDGTPEEELHYREKWFHGRLEEGRNQAIRLLKDYSHLGDGTFLVRDSDTFVGDFSLSFLWQGEINHCRIKSKQDCGQTKYYLVDTNMFDSLYSLIMYYRVHPLKSANYTMILKEPVPQPKSHEGKEWYQELCDRDQAEDMLRRVQVDGAFLVRRNLEDPNLYAISFRVDGKIKHCRIKHEDRLFTIGTAEFETLTDLVQYYERNALYKKMKLTKPVNKTVVEREGVDPLDTEALYGEGIYHQPNPKFSKVRVKALHDYQANREDELSFCKGAIITNVVKHDTGWWRGDYGEKKQFWFPYNFVEEIEPQDDSAESVPLGAMQKGAIDVQCCIVEQSARRDRYCFKIFTRSRGTPLEVAVDSEAEMKDWMENITLCASNLQDNSNIRYIEKKKQIAQEFSDLIVYCIAVPFDPERPSGNPCEMSSFQEAKAEKYCAKTRAKQFVKYPFVTRFIKAARSSSTYNRKQLSRVYPKGQRVDSSNYDPFPMWNCGAQMVALNYQTEDRPMQLNEGRFMRNGRCGYVLQPHCMRSDDYDPFDKRTIKVDPLTISVTIIAARHLTKAKRGIASPFVEIEIIGLECDNNKYKTVKIEDNGLNPVWFKSMTDFDIVCPDLALIRFVVMDEDVFGDPNFLGQATFPVQCLRSGFRSVPLKTEFSDELELAALLIFIDMRNPKEDEDGDIYASIQELRGRKEELTAQMNSLDSRTEERVLSRIQEELLRTEQIIIEKNEERRQRKCNRRQRSVVYRRTSNS